MNGQQYTSSVLIEIVRLVQWNVCTNSFTQTVLIELVQSEQRGRERGLFYINARNKKPIYEQLCEQLRNQVVEGIAVPGEALPSVRSLSTELGINPNTIQRAYRMMEEEGLTVSIPGNGNFVSMEIETFRKQKIASSLNTIRDEVKTLKRIGIQEQQITELIKDIYGGEGDDQG